MTPKKRQALEEFGKQVVKEVFDRACSVMQTAMKRGLRAKKKDPMHLAYESLDVDAKAIVRKYVVLAVDQTFAQFLHFLEVREVPIPIPLSPGEVIDIRGLSDGLSAEPYGESGWLARFSKFKDGIDP